MNVFEQPLDDGCRAPAVVEAKVFEEADLFDDMTEVEIFELLGFDEVVQGDPVGG